MYSSFESDDQGDDEGSQMRQVTISNLSIELLTSILQSCSEDFRLKFAITLQGIKRLVNINNCIVSEETDKESYINELHSIAESTLDALAILLV